MRLYVMAYHNFIGTYYLFAVFINQANTRVLKRITSPNIRRYVQYALPIAPQHAHSDILKVHDNRNDL